LIKTAVRFGFTLDLQSNCILAGNRKQSTSYHLFFLIYVSLSKAIALTIVSIDMDSVAQKAVKVNNQKKLLLPIVCTFSFEYDDYLFV